MARRALGAALLASVAVLQADARRASRGGTCTRDQMASQTAAINLECCDEPSEDCSGGIPHTCNAGCAELFLPFWRDCQDALGEQAARFRLTAAQCQHDHAPLQMPLHGSPRGWGLTSQILHHCQSALGSLLAISSNNENLPLSLPLPLPHLPPSATKFTTACHGACTDSGATEHALTHLPLTSILIEGVSKFTVPSTDGYLLG